MGVFNVQEILKHCAELEADLAASRAECERLRRIVRSYQGWSPCENEQQGQCQGFKAAAGGEGTK